MKVMKRILSLVLVLCLSLTLLLTGTMQAEAATYNASAAVSYANAHWNDGVGLCAQFVSNCLAAGGVTIPNSASYYSSSTQSYNNNSGTLGAYTNPYTCSASLLLYLSKYYTVITDPASSQIDIGDVVFMYSGEWRDGHVGIIINKNNGTPTYAAHNRATNTGKFYSNYPCTYVVKMNGIIPSVTHMKDSSYGTNFVAYPKAKITAANIFDAYHNQIDSSSWIGTSDKCTIHEVYTDGCCKVTYPLDAGGTKTVYSKISLFNTHTHSYTGVRVYENAHPHRISQRCVDYASCGGWIWTDEYKELKTCEQCWHADFDIVASSISIKVGESKTVSASLSGCLPDTAVMSRDFSPDNDVVEVTVANQQMTFTGLKAGTTNFSLTVYSDSSKSRILGTVTIPVTVISTHTHSYTGTRVYESAHPHAITQRCVDYATCGGWKYTGEYYEVKTCEQCWHADFDIGASSVLVKVGESKTVAVSVSGCLPDSAVALPSFSPDNDVAEVTIKNQQATFTGLKEGTTLFQIRIYSDSSKSYLIGATSIRVDVATPTYACEAGNHSYSYEEVPPTASYYGKLYGTCSLCGHKVTVALPALNTKDYVLTVLKEATCSEDGHGYYTWKTTTYGEYKYSAVIPATGHTYLAHVTEPNCTSNGYTTHVCLRCSLSYKDEYTKALGHTYVNGVCIRCDVEDAAGSGMGLIGDITGDGNVNMGDVSKLYAHIKGTSVLTDENDIDRCDVTGDGNVNMGDVSKLYAHIKGTSKLY